MNYKLYTSARIITHLNVILLLISIVGMFIFDISLKLENLNFKIFITLFILVYLLASIFNILSVSVKQFSITDHWIKKISLPLLLITSVGQEVFFRGVLNETIGIILSTILFTLWNFFPDKKRFFVTIFFFFLGLIQTSVYIYTKNIFYVIYTNFMFHMLIRMIKYKKQ